MHDRPHASEHADAIAAEPAFYQGWLAPRVAAAVAVAEDGRSPSPCASPSGPTPIPERVAVRKKMEKHPTLDGVFVRSRCYG